MDDDLGAAAVEMFCTIVDNAYRVDCPVTVKDQKFARYDAKGLVADLAYWYSGDWIMGEFRQTEWLLADLTRRMEQFLTVPFPTTDLCLAARHRDFLDRRNQ